MAYLDRWGANCLRKPAPRGVRQSSHLTLVRSPGRSSRRVRDGGPEAVPPGMQEEDRAILAPKRLRTIENRKFYDSRPLDNDDPVRYSEYSVWAARRSRLGTTAGTSLTSRLGEYP